jgi:hypothetical protein
MHIVTLDRLDSANLEVTAELHRFGLYDEPMQEVDTFLVTAGTAHGWQWYGGSGEIHIPRVSLSRLLENFRGEYTSLRDVLRHEFAHAVADTHRGLFRSSEFSQAFGGAHTWAFSWEHDPDHHVSLYAATAPAEDFAEVFMF